MTNGNGQARGPEPVERVVDLFVHMPIGFAVMAWKRVPDLVVAVPGLVGEALSKGCAQIAQAEERLTEEVRKARMIGQVAVTFGGRQLRREVDARLRDARQAAGGVASFVPVAGGEGGGPNGAAASPRSADSVTAAATPTAPVSAESVEAAPSAPAAKATGAIRKTAKSSTSRATSSTSRAKSGPVATKPTKAAATKKTSAVAAPSSALPASAADLPIREYDGLSASQVVSRLTGLTPGELQAIRAYEEASRGRRTVLLAIDRLVGPGEAGKAP